MKLYAITKGDYSDYHICALTSSKSKAKKLKLLYSGQYYDARIEEYEDGEGDDVNVCWWCDHNGCNAQFKEYPENERIVINPRTKEIAGVYVFSKDAAHAEKKAQDMIAEYKAKLAGL